MKGLIPFVGRTMFLLLIYVIVKYMLLLGCYEPSCLVFMDVGQGDGAVIKLDGDFNIVIDGGPSINFVHGLSKYIQIKEDIDLLVFTHFHRDHYLGLGEVINRYRVKTLVLPTSCVNNSEFNTILESFPSVDIIYTNYVSIHFGRKGADPHITYGDSVHGCFISQREVNNSSVIVELDYLGKYILYMGDAEVERESIFLRNYSKDISILKAGHHCSDSSTSIGLLSKLKPEIVICSYGFGNSYGHPGRDLQDRLQRLGAKVLSTAEIGDIVIKLDK